MCRYGHGVVRGLFEEYGSNEVKGFVIWLPMMDGDDASFAKAESELFDDQRFIQFWDPEKQVGGLYTGALGLQATAWDVYFLYAPGTTWEEDGPPMPAYWTHQLPADAGTDPSLLLNPSTLFRELAKLLGNRAEAKRPDLGLFLHLKGLISVHRDAGSPSAAQIYQAADDSKIAD